MSKFLRLVSVAAFFAAFFAPVSSVLPLFQGQVAPSAFAHDTLISYSPSGTVHEEPKKIVMQFTGSPLPNGTFLIVTDHHNNKYAKGSPKLSGGTLTQELLPLTPGREYFVDWKITSTDGHPLGGTFSFFYAAAGAQKPSHADHDHAAHSKGDHADHDHAAHSKGDHADHDHAAHDSHTKPNVSNVAPANKAENSKKTSKSADLSSQSTPIVLSVIALIIALAVLFFVFKIRMRRKEKK